MPQLSFAELIARDVPVAAGEAVALTLTAAAVADATAPGQPLPTLEQIFLSSTGDVTIACRPAESGLGEGEWLTSLLCGLLRLDEPEHRARCRGRVPGGLLVLVARMRGQIDLPPLPEGALRSSLMRFSARAEPALMAAIFWRAARSRSRQPDRLVASGAGVDRRTRGPSASELRKWLRQTELELFTLQRQGSGQAVRLVRKAAVGVGRATAIVAFAALAISLGFRLSSVRTNVVDRLAPAGVVALDSSPPTAPVPIAFSPVEPQGVSSPRPKSSETPKRRQEAKISRVPKIRQNQPRRAAVNAPPNAPAHALENAPPSAPAYAAENVPPNALQPTAENAPATTPAKATSASRPKRSVRTVRMVNLPRATWAVVQETSSIHKTR